MQGNKFKRVFFTAPDNKTFYDVEQVVKMVIEKHDLTFWRLNYNVEPEGIENELPKIIDSYDFVIADITYYNPWVMYELGVAQTLGKPIITIAQFNTHHELSHFNCVSYHRQYLLDEFSERLYVAISDLIENPSDYINKYKQRIKRKKVFISYSHQDKKFLDRLLVHLKPLMREGLIDLWADNQLKPGDIWKKEIKAALTDAAIGILLISADFLASDFIVENELPPLLVIAEEEGKRIIPVIVKPSRFSRDPTISRFQAINDPKRPLIDMDESEQEHIYEKVAEMVESSIA